MCVFKLRGVVPGVYSWADLELDQRLPRWRLSYETQDRPQMRELWNQKSTVASRFLSPITDVSLQETQLRRNLLLTRGGVRGV